MPLKAAIFSYDASGSPTLLADPRTPATEQLRQFRAIKSGDQPAPDDAVRIEFVEWHSEQVERWMPTVATKSIITKKGKSK